MSDPVELSTILQDLASGKIGTDQAAALIAAAKPAVARPRLGVESLYDTPPARAISVEDEELEASGQSDTGPAGTDQAAPPDQVSAEEPKEQGEASPTESGTGEPDDDRVVFSLGTEDLAATAGEVLKEAGDFAKSAWQWFGQFAGGLLPDAAPQAGESYQQPPSAGGSRGIERLVLRSVGRRVRLIGDPKVATIAIEGPHTLRRQGVILEINTEGELGLKLEGFNVVRPPRSVEDLRVLGFGQDLVVRVNPAIPVDAEVTGSRLTTVNVPHLGKVRVSAGSANLSGVVEVTDALVQAGGASLSGPLSQGRSRVRVESGNLSIRLTPGANVTIRSQTQLGRVSWPGEPHGDVDEFVVGNGAAQLEIGVVMGRAVVHIED